MTSCVDTSPIFLRVSFIPTKISVIWSTEGVTLQGRHQAGVFFFFKQKRKRFFPPVVGGG